MKSVISPFAGAVSLQVVCNTGDLTRGGNSLSTDGTGSSGCIAIFYFILVGAPFEPVDETAVVTLTAGRIGSFSRWCVNSSVNCNQCGCRNGDRRNRSKQFPPRTLRPGTVRHSLCGSLRTLGQIMSSPRGASVSDAS